MILIQIAEMLLYLYEKKIFSSATALARFHCMHIHTKLFCTCIVVLFKENTLMQTQNREFHHFMQIFDYKQFGNVRFTHTNKLFYTCIVVLLKIR